MCDKIRVPPPLPLGLACASVQRNQRILYSLSGNFTDKFSGILVLLWWRLLLA